MRSIFNPVSASCLCIVLLTASALQAGAAPHRTKPGTRTTHHLHVASRSVAFSAAFEEEANSVYNETGLEDIGLSRKAFEYAYKGYIYLLRHHMLPKNNILSVCDFSQSSRNKRLYVIDVEQRKVLINTYVAHGRGSGGEYARSFSNGSRSHKSSLGFYITEHTYYGDHGLALRIHGLEKGFNDHAARRSIVVHGSNYVGENFLESNRFNGRSFGCPAVPIDESGDIIETIKDGSCLFIYHPTKKYLTRSKILNS